jgi:hypothetical protein
MSDELFDRLTGAIPKAARNPVQQPHARAETPRIQNRALNQAMSLTLSPAKTLVNLPKPSFPTLRVVEWTRTPNPNPITIYQYKT